MKAPIANNAHPYGLKGREYDVLIFFRNEVKKYRGSEGGWIYFDCQRAVSVLDMAPRTLRRHVQKLYRYRLIEVFRASMSVAADDSSSVFNYAGSKTIIKVHTEIEASSLNGIFLASNQDGKKENLENNKLELSVSRRNNESYRQT
jgi:hypothetical protein